MGNYDIELTLDDTKVMAKLKQIEKLRKAIEKKVKDTHKQTRETWSMSVHVAQASWSMFMDLAEVGGQQISGMLQTFIGSVFSSIRILIPIFTAMELTPGMQAQAAFGLINVARGIGAAVMQQMKAQALEDENEQRLKKLENAAGILGVFDGVFDFTNSFIGYME